MSDWKAWTFPGVRFDGSPFGRRFFGPGEMRLAVLSLLEHEPKHGYQIIKDLESRCGRAYKASAGVVYPTLQQLEDEALVTSEQVDGRRVYRITATGQDELKREADAIRQIWRRAEGRHEWSRWVGPETTSVGTAAVQLMGIACRTATHQADYPEKIEKIQQILNGARREIEALDAVDR